MRSETRPIGSAPRPPIWAVLGLLAVLELAWLTWILSETLPSARAAGESLQRGYLLWRFIPEVVPGVSWHESFLGAAVSELSHPENLPQRLPIVFAAGLIALAGFSIGSLVLRAVGLNRIWSCLERIAVGYGLGMTALGLLALVSGRLGLLHPWTARIGLCMPIVAELGLRLHEGWSKRARSKTLTSAPTFPIPDLPLKGGVEGISRVSVVALLVIVGPFLILMALGAMLPTIEFDALEYHLQGPKEAFLAGRLSYLAHNVYTTMPSGVEMLHLIGMNVVDDWWWGALVGQLIIASFAPMAGLAIWLTARRWGSPRAAWVASVVYLTTPWVYRLAAIPFVEGPLCYYHAVLVWMAGMAWSAPPETRPKLWLITGALAGGSMAIKYPALISAVLPFGAVAIAASMRARSPRLALAFSLGVAGVIGPWLIKNLIDTGNPVYPLGFQIFGGRDWDPSRDQQWSNVHGPRPIGVKALLDSVVDVAGRSDWQSPALIALAPLAFLRAGTRRMARLIGAYVGYLFLTWWLLTHRLDRFWLPLLPGLAVLAGLGADWIKNKVWTAMLAFILVVSTATNFVFCSTALTGSNEWTSDLKVMRLEVPKRLNPPLFRLDAALPNEAKVLVVGQAAVFHLSHPVVYNTVFNRETFETIDRDRSPDAVRQELNRRGITHIYVDWHEIDRYRSPGNYGFTDYMTPARLTRLKVAGVLSEPQACGPHQDLYTVLPAH